MAQIPVPQPTSKMFCRLHVSYGLLVVDMTNLWAVANRCLVKLAAKNNTKQLMTNRLLTEGYVRHGDSTYIKSSASCWRSSFAPLESY